MLKTMSISWQLILAFGLVLAMAGIIGAAGVIGARSITAIVQTTAQDALPRAERGELFRGLKVTLVSLGIVTLVLGTSTAATLINLNRNLRVEEVFENEILKRSAEVVSTNITNRRGIFIIDATVVSYAASVLSPAQITQLQEALEEAVGGPVQVNITALPGYRTQLEGLEIQRRIEILFTGMVVELGGHVNSVAVEKSRDVYVITSIVIGPQDEPITRTQLAEMQEEISNTLGVPVSIRATIVPGQQIPVVVLAPTPPPGP